MQVHENETLWRPNLLKEDGADDLELKHPIHEPSCVLLINFSALLDII